MQFFHGISNAIAQFMFGAPQNVVIDWLLYSIR
ncbi:hypothetical protein BJY24_005565 [Nocardia transvalensis]|uniref:Uncharacterized protein n=1 Tax=Nocardia transvalensis TaxID=37333 RepID=A0A7W9UKK5_9NOCA|nr:hypothetical protein [Nocardia transvalensis]